MKKEILKMENITKIYTNGFIANKDINFSVASGEIHGLIGENGAGKTTLMKVLFGLESPQEGRIIVDGEETTFANPLDAFDKGIGMVHQHFMQCDGLTVAENIVLGIEPGRGQHFDYKEAVRMANEAAEKFRLPIDAESKIRDISVGEKQKVELIKALIRGVRVLILDEPTAVLTPQETRTLFKQLKYLKEQGYGIVFISHKLDEVMEICDRVTVLRRGLMTGSGNIKDLSEDKLANMIVGRDVVLSFDKDKAKPRRKILEIENLNFVNNIGRKKVDNLNLVIRSGEVVGVAGVEGNGQSELSDIISGMSQITDGHVSVNGESIKGKTINGIRKLGVSHISEDRMLYGCALDLSIRDNIASIYLDKKEFTNGLLVNDKAIDELVDRCIEEFEIACFSGKQTLGLLSGGNIQKVIVAREFLSEKPLILANQPTRGIDVGTAELIRRSLIDYTRTTDCGALLISSDLNEVLEVSDRLIVMKDGRIVAHFEDAKNVTDELLGEYMLGLKEMTEEEMRLNG